jgi:hypothetical protein
MRGRIAFPDGRRNRPTIHAAGKATGPSDLSTLKAPTAYPYCTARIEAEVTAHADTLVRRTERENVHAI